MAADLDTLLTAEIPEGRQNLLDSFTNLERVAEYCENNYYQCENKRAALEETKSYTTQSLASVAYQINTLAYNFLQSLDLQSSQLGEMESQVNHITQTVGIHKEKVARREIGVLTTNKAVNRQYKIIAPATPERPIKYVRKPIDYADLDEVGHGVRVVPQKQHLHIQQQPPQPQQLQRASSSGGYGTGMQGVNSTYGSIGNVSNNSAGPGPAPTTKPPTPPQASRIYSSGGTLNRSKGEYRTPPVVAPPQVPSNYAPNYPMQPPPQPQQQVYQKGPGKQYGTLPHPQVQMVHPVQQANEGGNGGATMPRLSSASMRSTSSISSNEYPIQASTLGRPSLVQNQPQMYRQSSATPPSSLGSRQSTPPSQYGVMTRPSARPPSPPLPPPPMQQQSLPQQQQALQIMQQKYMQQQQQQQQQQNIYGRQNSAEVQQQLQGIYGRQNSEPNARPNMSNLATEAMYARQLSTGPPTSQPPQGLYGQLTKPQPQPPQQLLQPPQPPQQPPVNQYARKLSQPNAMMPPSAPTQPGTGNDKAGQPGTGSGWVPPSYLERVSAIYDYSADKDDELSFHEGSIIYVLKKNDDGWWEGVMDGVTGLFPGNYVEATI